MDCRRYYDTVGEVGFNHADLVRFKQTFPHLLESGSLLDVGCGEGYWLNHLDEKKNLDLSGLDISPVRLKIARRNVNKEKILLLVADIRKLPYKDGQFDQITALEVLEHIPNWQDGLSELVRVASKKVVISVPYNEKLKYDICPNCKTDAYLSGHLHSFTENDFKSLDIDGDFTFEKLPRAFGLNHYIKIAFNYTIKGVEKLITMDRESGHALSTVCPNCYEEVPYTKFFERASHRLIRIITRSPEFLLVQIDK